MQSRHSDFKRKMVLFALMVLVVALVASTAFAHTGLSSSSPAEGQAVDGPLDTISLSFTGTPIADDESVAVADEAGATILPVSVVQTGNDVVATFDPPLGAGSYALAWRVRADDTHFVDGTISFGVLAPFVPPTTTPTDTAAPTTANAVVPVTTSATPESADNDANTDLAESGASASEDQLAVQPDNASAVVAPLAPALGEGSSDEGEGVTQIGRLLMFPAAITAIGMIIFAAFAFAGRREELGTLIRAVRWLGVAVLFGALLELVGLSALLGGFGETVSDSAGRASLARLVGGGLLVVGFGAVAGSVSKPLTRSLSAAVAEHPNPDIAVLSPASSERRWRPTGIDALGLLGAGLIIASFAFDGHTVSRGPRALHALTRVLHVAGAAAGAGGLVALAVVLWRRQHDGVASHALEMIVRFSVLAMVALAVTGVAGVAMALFIDTDVLGYVSTDWGRLMILKFVLVAAAALLGAYNHLRVLPALTAEPDNFAVVATTRRTVTVEAGLVVAAAMVTAVLVAASTL
jgi:copper transport protein